MPEHARVMPGRLIYGTMRMGEVTRNIHEWGDFLAAVHALGITKLHSSSEYETFPMLCEILHHLGTRTNPVIFEHIVKLAEPSFDDTYFDGVRLAQKIDAYRTALCTECVQDIQWMWRQNLNDDAGRIAKFKQSAMTMADAAKALKSAGKIKRLLCFAYSAEFALAAIDMNMIDGLTVYRNAHEKEYDPVIENCAAQAKTVLVIRPLNSGKVLVSGLESPAEQVRYALDMPAIEAGIISSNHLDHIRELLA